MSDKAHELILEIYRQRNELAARGEEPTSVVMSMELYREIQHYHALLGEMPDGAVDYISKYRIFDLEICIEPTDRVRVE